MFLEGEGVALKGSPHPTTAPSNACFALPPVSIQSSVQRAHVLHSRGVPVHPAHDPGTTIKPNAYFGSPESIRATCCLKESTSGCSPPFFAVSQNSLGSHLQIVVPGKARPGNQPARSESLTLGLSPQRWLQYGWAPRRPDPSETPQGQPLRTPNFALGPLGRTPGQGYINDDLEFVFGKSRQFRLRGSFRIAHHMAGVVRPFEQFGLIGVVGRISGHSRFPVGHEPFHFKTTRLNSTGKYGHPPATAHV